MFPTGKEGIIGGIGMRRNAALQKEDRMTYDIIISGSGPAGLAAAVAARGRGKRDRKSVV